MYIESQNKAPIEHDIVFEERPNKNDKKNTTSGQQKGYTRRGYKELALNLFERSPEIGRLLVRLHDRNKLYAMAKSPDDLARSELTQTAVDLLGFELSPSERELIADVLMSLINQAERDLRRALSERFAVMQGVPLRLILKMASDEIFVADPVLRKSADLTDFDLIYILKAQGADHWQSIAQRPQISEKLVDMLVDTNDFGTTLNIVNNKSVSLSTKSLRKAFTIAKDSETLADPLLARSGLPEEFVSELYQHVGAELKQYIKDNFKNIEEAVEALDDVIDEFSQSAEHAPTQDMVAQAELMMAKNILTPTVMIDNLRSGKISNFVAQLSVYCGLPIETVDEMIRQKAAQTMAIACKANLIPKGDFINMFLLTSRVRGARIIDEGDLSRAIAYYDKISEEMAKSLMKKYRH